MNNSRNNHKIIHRKNAASSSEPTESSLRRRGWSIMSETDTNAGTESRPRAYTDQSEDTIEKMNLLETFPSSDQASASSDLFQQEESSLHSSSDADAPPAKRRRITHCDTEETAAATATHSSSDLLVHNAKKATLSKWAMRLLDASRPRGLIETPQVIPLNDEFLLAFGRRHKETSGHHSTFRVEDDDASNSSSSDIDESKQLEQGQTTTHTNGVVSIVNMAYTTSTATLFKSCERYGPVLRIDLPLDSTSKANNNTGRATVVFEYPDDAARFVESMHQQTMDGRQIYTYLMNSRPTTTTTTTHVSSDKPATSHSASRYFIKDISTRCYRCGLVGHISGSCPNPEKPKPCPLCATLLTVDNDSTGHAINLKACPLSKVCFNCGSPGHINIKCPFKRGSPKRMVCTACFSHGHHHWSCTSGLIQTRIPCAKCMTCGTFLYIIY